MERGLASDEVWYDLAQVCLQLGHDEEAARIWRQMDEGATRNRLQSLLVRRGLIDPPARHHARDVLGPDQSITRRKVGAVGELAPEPVPSLFDHLRDALHFLLLERMPLLVLVSMLAFPLVVGLGGFLTAGGSPFLLPAVAALPGLCVLGIVGALGHSVLIDATRGGELPPPLPDLGTLTRQAFRYLTDVTVISVVMLGPSVLILALGAPVVAAVPGFVLGGFLLPMALAMRQVRDDWRAMSMGFLLTSIGRTCYRYSGIVLAFWLMFLPAAALVVVTGHMKLWLQIAVIGPFAVLPVFTTARILGTFLDSQRMALAEMLGAKARRRAEPPAPAPSPAPAAPRVQKREHPKAPAKPPRLPAAPDSIAHMQTSTALQKQASPQRPAPARPQPQAPAQPRRPAPTPQQQQQRPQQKRPPAPQQQQTPPALPPGLDLPHGLSAAAIVTGAERQRLGAASRRE